MLLGDQVLEWRAGTRHVTLFSDREDLSFSEGTANRGHFYISLCTSKRGILARLQFIPVGVSG